MNMEISGKEQKIIDSIYGFGLKKPDSVLPESIKERIRYFGVGLEDYLTLSRCIQYILPGDDNEDELEKEYCEFNTTSWLPVSPEVRDWQHSDASFLAEQQVAISLIYGMNNENYLLKYGDYYLDNRFVLSSLKQDICFSEKGAERAIKRLDPAVYISDPCISDKRISSVAIYSIQKDTEIPKKFKKMKYVFKFKVGQKNVGMNAEPLDPMKQDCFHYTNAINILESLKSIKPEIKTYTEELEYLKRTRKQSVE